MKLPKWLNVTISTDGPGRFVLGIVLGKIIGISLTVAVHATLGTY